MRDSGFSATSEKRSGEFGGGRNIVLDFGFSSRDTLGAGNQYDDVNVKMAGIRGKLSKVLNHCSFNY